MLSTETNSGFTGFVGAAYYKNVSNIMRDVQFRLRSLGLRKGKATGDD